MKPKYTKKKCLRPDCDNAAHSRGLCVGCYLSARKLIMRGLTDWVTLEKKGKCNSASRTSRQNWFLK